MEMFAAAVSPVAVTVAVTEIFTVQGLYKSSGACTDIVPEAPVSSLAVTVTVKSSLSDLTERSIFPPPLRDIVYGVGYVCGFALLDGNACRRDGKGNGKRRDFFLA